MMHITDHTDAYLLLLPEFDEQAVLDTLHTFHRSGRQIRMLGFSRRPVCGAQGLRYQPDCTLEQVQRERPAIVIIPDGSETERLRTDPRLLALLERTLAAGGRVLTEALQAYQLQRVGIATRPLDQHRLDAFLRTRERQNGVPQYGNQPVQIAYAPDYTML